MTRKVQEAGLRAVRGSTLEERKRERRERLVDAGVAQFGEKGYHRVTVRDVCGEARLTERYFYESFTNLGALFIASYERANRPLRQRTMQALATSERSPLGLARSALDAFIRYLGENPRCTRILLFESVAIGGEVFRFASESTEDYVTLLQSFLEAASPEGLPPARTDYVASALIGASIYAAMRWHREGYRDAPEVVIESVFALYRGLYHLKAIPSTSAGELPLPAHSPVPAVAEDPPLPDESRALPVGKAGRAR